MFCFRWASFFLEVYLGPKEESFFFVESCVLASSLRFYDMKTRKNEPQRPHTVTHYHLKLPDNPKQNCTQKNSKLFLAHVEQKIEVQKLDFGKKKNL